MCVCGGGCGQWAQVTTKTWREHQIPQELEAAVSHSVLLLGTKFLPSGRIVCALNHQAISVDTLQITPHPQHYHLTEEKLQVRITTCLHHTGRKHTGSVQRNPNSTTCLVVICVPAPLSFKFTLAFPYIPCKLLAHMAPPNQVCFAY